MGSQHHVSANARRRRQSPSAFLLGALSLLLAGTTSVQGTTNWTYVPDPNYENHSCQGQNRCTSDADCTDPNHVTGSIATCGTTQCETSKGSCRFTAWNSSCPQTFTQCANTHALCYEGPTGVNYLGSCSGFSNNECRYAWCKGETATTTTTSTTTTSTTSSDGRVPTSLTVTGTSSLDVGGNVKLTATVTFSGGGGSEDVTSTATWTSSAAGNAKFNFPGLLEGVASGSVSVTASYNGVTSSALTVTVAAPATSGSPTCELRTTKMRALVIYQSEELDATRGVETAVPAIKRALGYVGVPYDMVRQDDLGTDVRWIDQTNKCEGNYQAVIASDGTLRWQAGSYNDIDNYHLDAYMRTFDVRLVNWYTWPSSAFGWSANPPAYGTGDDFNATFTSDGLAVFDYIKSGYTLEIKNVWNQVAQPIQGSSLTKPLLVDSIGNCFGLLHDDGTGWETLTLTFGSNENMRHIIVLMYGIVNWVTRGKFVGFRRVYLRADMDDYLIDDDIFTPDTPCGTPVDQTGTKWRMNATDLQCVIDWQDSLVNDNQTAEVVLDMVYNGIGSNGQRFPSDTLTPLTKTTEQKFRWVSHGWDHLNEDNTSYTVAWEEVYHNQLIALPSELNLTMYTDDTMVTGQVSGLKNPNFLTAARDLGIRYLVSDTSRAGENPGDNLGLYNWYVPEILMIPRRPNSLFYNVALREEWIHEYNCIFGEYWEALTGNPNRTLAQIIDFEAEALVTYMLRGEKYPWMFHQANMRAYWPEEGGPKKFLLEELFDAVFSKFKAIYTIDITSPAMDVLGRDVISHMEIGTHNVQAVSAPGLGMIVTATNATNTPFTGYVGDTNRLYNGQNQAYVTLEANTPRFIREY